MLSIYTGLSIGPESVLFAASFLVLFCCCCCFTLRAGFLKPTVEIVTGWENSQFPTDSSRERKTFFSPQ